MSNATEIHYEIFTRRGSKGGWKLHDICRFREEALKLAQGLMADGSATGVKVVKETYHLITGDYFSLKIFEDGHNRSQTDIAEEDLPSALPCFKPDDLYSYHARATIARLLSDYLARHKLTVTELIHRADALEKFEATGTTLQHAVQRIAVAQAASTKRPVAQIIKSLNELVEKAIARVQRDDRKHVFPNPTLDEFTPLADKLARSADAKYILHGAIANHLADTKGWDQKLERLLAILERCRAANGDGRGEALLRDCVDCVAAEILSGSAAIVDLIGPHDNLGDAINTLVHLFLGQLRSDKPAGGGLALIANHFAADLLPNARTALAGRIMAELKSIKRLGSDMLLEIAELKKIANQLVLGIGKYLSHDDLISAFTLRSQRLVTYESLGRFLNALNGADEKIEKLLVIEESIIGAANKRQLANVLLPIATGLDLAEQFLKSDQPALVRLQRLTDLQRRVLRSGLPESTRRDLATGFDRVATEIEAKSRILDLVISRSKTPVEALQTLLKLSLANVFTEGALSNKARAIAAALANRPGFIDSYAASAKVDTDAARNLLAQSLAKAGLTESDKLVAA